MSFVEQEQESVLVVVEAGAACLYWMDHWGAQPENGWSMLEQEAGEKAASFRERLAVALDRCAHNSSDCERILFVAGARASTSALTTRWEIATALMAHLVKLGHGRLILTRGYGESPELEGDLALLAEDIEEAWRGSGPTVVARLEGALDEIAPARTKPLDSAPFAATTPLLEESSAA